MQNRRKRIIVISTVIAVIAVLVLSAGCISKSPSTTTASTTAADIAKLKADVTALQTEAATQAEDIATLQNEPTGTNWQPTINQLQSSLNQANSDIDSLQSKVDALNQTVTTLSTTVASLQSSGGSTTTPTGQCTVEIVGTTPLQVISATTAVPFQFTVKVTNNTDGYRYISYGLLLTCVTPPADLDIDNDTVIDNVTLDTFGVAGVTYSVIATPNIDAATQVLILQTSPRFAVASGSTLTIQHVLQIQSAAGEQWDGNLTGVVVSTTW